MLLLILIALSRHKRLSTWLTTLLLITEIVIVNGLLAVNGAASNPFGVVLLIPVVLAFMLLPIGISIAILFISIALQSAQLLLLSAGGHSGHAMLGHYNGMVLGFVFTSLLIGVVVRYFRWQVASREMQLQKMRERQLRDEQLLAIGTAAAQLTHDVATPAQTIHLLLEEASELPSPPSWLAEVQSQFTRIETKLRDWRTIANDIREKRMYVYTPAQLWQQLQGAMRTARPEAAIDWQAVSLSEVSITADRTLIPAVTSVLINACEADSTDRSSTVEVRCESLPDQWLVVIKNQITDANDDMFQHLGNQIVPSANGYGVGAVLSNATIERFGGTVTWQRDNSNLTTRITLPVSS